VNGKTFLYSPPLQLTVPTNIILEVNAKSKRLQGFFTILLIAFVATAVLGYIIFLRGVMQDTWLAAFISHVKVHVAGFTLLGSFYTALFGGLFFIFGPLEAYFMGALSKGHPVALYAVFMLGTVLSYFLNYLLGLRLSGLTRRLISVKSFYQLKCWINRYGKGAIFISNLVPLMPSQQVTFVLGIFRYNQVKLFLLSMPAQMLKYSLLLVAYRTFV
jgi:membrane protein YqaA with SNARE-associated domain